MSRKHRPQGLGPLTNPWHKNSHMQSAEPLVTLTKTIVECRPESRSPLDRPLLSPKASCFFNLHSFPSSFTPLRSQFDLFDIQPQALHTCDTRVSESLVLARPFTAPPDLVMSLRKLSSDEGNSGMRFDFAARSGSSSGPESLAASAASLVSDGSGGPDTARAAREAMDTPLDTRSSGHSRLQKPRHLVQLLGRNDDCPKVLTATIASELRSAMPVQQRLAKSLRLVYSMDQHGISMHTMLSCCESEKALVLAIKDTNGRPLRLSPTFYGQGTSFLWKAFRSSPQSRRKDAVRCFKYSGANEYFILCDPDFVAIGGGRGKFGLWFKGDFLHGYSARCPTFNNEPLCLDPSHSENNDPNAQQEFVVGHLELWAFDT
ncbi:oxidation resistance protein 1 [Coemansia sp. RSA 678]|nr:oxidation resistance protein 1 [Coemansia sp. RSA 678]